MSPKLPQAARRLPSWPALLAGAGVLVTLVTAIILLRYACPTADDFYRAGIVQVRPWYAEIARNYREWTGRWAGVGLALVVHPRVDLVRWYPLLLGGLITIQALGLVAFWRTLLGGTAARRQVLGLAGTTMAVIWAGLPSPGETWYWMSGGLENFLGIFLSLILIWGLVRTRWEDIGTGRARAGMAALSLLAFFVTGLQETLAAMLCLVLVPGTIITYLNARSGETVCSPRRLRAWQVVCLFALIGFAVVVLAPGNGGRATNLLQGRSADELRLSHALKVAWVQGSQEVSSWVFDLRLLAATMALVLTPVFARARAGGLRWGGFSPRLVVIPIWALAVTAMFVGTIAALHGPMPPRTVSSAYALFVLGWIVAVFVSSRPAAGAGDSAADALQAAGPRFARSAALGVLGISLLLTGNTRDAIQALREGVPQNWNRMVHWRDHLIHGAAQGGASEIDLPVHDLAGANRARYPRLYNFDDIKEDKDYYVNMHLATYYGLKVLRRVPPGSRLVIKPERRPEAIGLKSDGATTVK